MNLALLLVLLTVIGLLTATTIYFAQGKLKAYRQTLLWVSTAQQMQRAAARALPFNPTLESTITGLYETAADGIEAENRL